MPAKIPPKKPRTAADGIARWRTDAERREVNEALDRGATWREIADICARHGRPGVTAANVSNYRKSRDRADWLRRCERLEAIRAESDITAAIVRHYAEQGGSPAEAGLLAAAETLTRALGGISQADIAGLLADDPREFRRALESLAKVSAFLQRERALRTAQPDNTPPPPAADPQAAIRLIYGL